MMELQAKLPQSGTTRDGAQGATMRSVYYFSSCELYHIALRHICSEGSGFTLIGTDDKLPESFERLLMLKPDLIVIDAVLLTATDSKPIAEVIHHLSCIARVLILANAMDVQFACAAIIGGASGYLLLSMTVHEFRQAFRAVADGATWLGQDLTHTIIGQFASAQRSEVSSMHRLLSQREQQILNRVARGETSKQIAKELFLSESSVRTYWYRILNKLNALNKADAIARATRFGLLDPVGDEDAELLLTRSPQLRTLWQGRARVGNV